MQMFISVKQAEQLIQHHIPACTSETCPIQQAEGRILHQKISADRDIPSYNRVMMDGIAINHSQATNENGPFTIECVSPAGAPPPTLQDSKAGCIEIMTGSVLPVGCNTIIPYEDVEIKDQSATLHVDTQLKEGQFIHQQGSDHIKNDCLLKPGCRLHAPQLAIAASVGNTTLQVAKQPTIAVISTGDELIPLGQPMETWQIHPINTYSIQASIEGPCLGICHPYHLPDEETIMHKQLKTILHEHDIMIISGGVSMGKFDLVPRVLMDLSVEPIFHKIKEKPGKPLWFGVAPSGKPVFGLPGNPVSTLVCLHRYIIPALTKAAGSEFRVRYAQLSEQIDFDAPLTYFPPVREIQSVDGIVKVEPLPFNNSGHFTTLANSDGFVELPAEINSFLPGTVVRYQPWVN